MVDAPRLAARCYLLVPDASPDLLPGSNAICVLLPAAPRLAAWAEGMLLLTL